MGVYSLGPFVAGSTASYNVWCKTRSDGEMVLVHYDRIWTSAKKAEMNMFSLTLDNGKPVLYASKTSRIKPMNTGMSPLNDGGWHQVAVSMPCKGFSLSEVKIFIGGKRINTSVDNDEVLFLVGFGALSIGELPSRPSNKLSFVLEALHWTIGRNQHLGSTYLDK